MTDASTVRLVQFTDPHLYGDPQQQMRGVATLATLEAVVAAAAPALATADAIVLSGDLVHDDINGYRHFPTIFGTQKAALLAIPGNHDDARALAGALAPRGFRTAGHIDRGGWRIVLCDSSVPGSAGGELGDRGLDALEGALADAGERHVLVILHHHPVPMHSAWLDGIGLQDSPAFLERLRRHGRVRGVLFGHVHQAHDSCVDGLRFLGTPSTCVQFKPRCDDFALDSLPPAWRELELLPDGRIATRLGWLSVAR
ncbi:MAG: hypothetical protein RL026_2082 [Pseudomonadota bacterium]|jgi:Icc protein